MDVISLGGDERVFDQGCAGGADTLRRPKIRGFVPSGTVMVTVSVPACGVFGRKATMGASVQPDRSVPCWKTWVVSEMVAWMRRKVKTRFPAVVLAVGRIS